MAVLIFVNLLINSVWMLGSWIVVLYSISIVMFLMAENLFRYFLWGFRRTSNNFFILSFVVWGVLLFQLGFYFKPSDLSQSLLWGVSLFVGSLLAYSICWLVSVQRIRKKGFPEEEESLDLKKVEAFAEELKRRQSERQS